MQLAIISGSHRQASQSAKVAHYAQQLALDTQLATQAEVISLAGNPIPLWDEGVWAGEERWTSVLGPIQQTLSQSDALIIVTPEWNGQAPSGLKNLLLLLGLRDVGHKPALIISVSSSDGGAYPVAELRMSSCKNNRICYLPEHLVIRHVESVFNADPEQNNAAMQDYFHERLQWNLQLLNAYAGALTQVRANVAIYREAFPYGM